LALGQAPSDAYFFNYRNHRIPVEVPVALRADIRELMLFASADQGRSWSHVAGPIAADKDHFAFFAPGDGAYWLRVVQVNRSGVQSPDDRGIKNGPPDMKLSIDTLKPIIKSFQAQRHDDDIYINWDVQEDNLDPKSMRLEYQTKDSLDAWKPISMQAGLKGQARIAPGHRQPVTLRLTVSDLAKNESFGIAEVAGTVVAASFNAGGPAPITTPNFPKEIVAPKPLEQEKPPLAMPPAPIGIEKIGEKPFVNPGSMFPPPPIAKENPSEKVIADSSLPPPPPVTPKVGPGDIVPPLGGINPPGQKDSPFDVKPIANALPAKKALPTLQYVNQHQVMLEYELKRVGPAGIGGIEVWLTKNEGEMWEPFAEDKDTQSGAVNRRQSRLFDLRDDNERPFVDGIYGLSLVVKSRAGLGKKPRPGDVPEIRIEVDTQLPDAQLFAPVPDPQFPEQVLLKWSARDKNLTDKPIHLEYSARPDGDWQPIKIDLENTGRYTNERVTGDFSWKVPVGTPIQVYLRMRVRDKAGNERVLVTPQPQFIDLTEPEGSLIGVQSNQKNP